MLKRRRIHRVKQFGEFADPHLDLVYRAVGTHAVVSRRRSLVNQQHGRKAVQCSVRDATEQGAFDPARGSSTQNEDVTSEIMQGFRQGGERVTP